VSAATKQVDEKGKAAAAGTEAIDNAADTSKAAGATTKKAKKAAIEGC
jgi:hypothetical protein